jgi:YHS domain-containing protein
MLAALAACLTVAATPAIAAVPWHADLPQAKAASVISHRPVLIVFTAKWSEASISLDETTLANPEATALVTACFEPVKVDVDADPETTRRMGVSYLPTACVIDLDDRVLATFDCPDSPASFIAAAGRAAQDAATAKAAHQTATPAAPAAPVSTPSATRPRDHSDFTAATPAAPTVAATHTAEPSLPKNPPAAWPAEKVAAPATTPSPAATAAVRPTLEPTAPAAPAAPAGVATWLGEQRPVPTATPAPAAAPAPATALTPAAPPATSGPEEKPKQSNAFIAALQKPFTLLPKWPGTGKQAASPQTASPSAPATTSVATIADANASMPLGLEGYCPVTLAEKGTWVEGRAQFGARHRGRTYIFSGAEQQQAFLADPDRYAPALSGDDPVMAFDAGRSIPGQRRYGVTYQSRIYLFSSPETRTAFAADPGKYTARVRVAEAGSAMPSTVQR